MAERRRASEVRKVELTDAALHIIATRGIAALSTRSLAAQVGLSSGAIFRHFASLEALLEAVVARVEEVLVATYPPATVPPLERLARFVERRSAVVGDQLGILRLVVSEQFVLALPEQGAGRLAACVDETRAFIVRCLREGQAEGAVRDDVAPEALAPIVMGTVQMLALSKTAARKRAAEAKAVRDGLLRLLRPPAAPRRPARAPREGDAR